jgi:ferric-dicitrate binding protein FerR (iron transport regulator)
MSILSNVNTDAEDALTREEPGVHADDATWRAERRLTVAIGAALRADQGAETARTVLELIRSNRGSGPRRLVQRSLTTRKRQRRASSRWPWAAAALLLVSVGAGSWWALQPPVLAQAADGRALIAGDVVTTPGALRFHDGTQVTVGANTMLSLISAQDRRGVGAAKRLRLEVGTLTAVVTKQPVAAPLTITTPHGEVTVVGTEFTLSTETALSRLAVREGRVRFGNAVDTIDVGAGAAATLTLGLKPQLIVDAPPAPVPPTPVLPTPLMIWDLDAPQASASWTHGALTTVDGRRCIEGRAGYLHAQNASLVRWVTPVGKPWVPVLAATLHVEAFVPASVNQIHVQVHHRAGYNWGATIPVQGGRWQVCRVRLDQLTPYGDAPKRPLVVTDELDDLILLSDDASAGPSRFRDLRLDPP